MILVGRSLKIAFFWNNVNSIATKGHSFLAILKTMSNPSQRRSGHLQLKKKRFGFIGKGSYARLRLISNQD